MEDQKNELWSKFRLEPQYLIFLFSLIILLVFIVVFVRPVYPAPLDQTAEPTSSVSTITPQVSTDTEITPTPTSLPPTPEEIGYTDGIIFWATALVIILLVGTLRETLRRRGE